MKFWRVLLDSGANGDLLFVQKGSRSKVPTSKRISPSKWRTSKGTFQTKYVANVYITIPEYSNSKVFSIEPDVVEVEGTLPTYNLILGHLHYKN